MLDSRELDEVRALFQLKPDDLYLACASRSPLARRTMNVGVKAIAKKQLPWTLSDGEAENVRAAFAQLINCSPADVALCPSTSFAISTAARAVGSKMQPGDVGIILEEQMSSNVYPWQFLQRNRGLALEAIPYPSDGNWTAALLDRLAVLEKARRRVAVVAIPIFLWTDGSGPLDLAAISAVCRDLRRTTRTVLLVDATQSIGAVPFDVQKTPVDFLMASVHKWLFGPYGLSCFYVAREWWEDPRLEPLVEDEHARAHMANGDDEVAFDVGLPGYPVAYHQGARRLDGGGRPNPIILPMALDGMTLVKQWGPSRISAALAPLTDRLRERCVRELGLWAPALHGPHFLGIGPGDTDLCFDPREVAAWVNAAAAFLKRNHIYVSARLKCLRVAPHLYTSLRDIDRVVETLASFLALRRAKPTACL